MMNLTEHTQVLFEASNSPELQNITELGDKELKRALTANRSAIEVMGLNSSEKLNKERS
jgi:hypothetical protein